MPKIRINHLARELAVRSRAIIAVLPLVGVTKKKKTSSSIDENEAERVRAYFPARAICPKCKKNVRADELIRHTGSKECLAYLAAKRRRRWHLVSLASSQVDCQTRTAAGTRTNVGQTGRTPFSLAMRIGHFVCFNRRIRSCRNCRSGSCSARPG